MSGVLKVLAVGCLCLSLTGVSGCVQDPSVEDDVPARPGAQQPEGEGEATLTAQAACDKLGEAESSARARLKCRAAAERPCEATLAIAGSLPCDAYSESTVTACVATMAHYSACSDFDLAPCVVTAVETSCHPPVPPDAGIDASRAPDAALPGEGGAPDAETDPDPVVDAGVPSVPDAAPPDAAPPDASPI